MTITSRRFLKMGSGPARCQSVWKSSLATYKNFGVLIVCTVNEKLETTTDAEDGQCTRQQQTFAGYSAIQTVVEQKHLCPLAGTTMTGGISCAVLHVGD